MSCIPTWFWGPMVTLEDCLAAFFAADELKGKHTMFDIYECGIMNVTAKGKKIHIHFPHCCTVWKPLVDVFFFPPKGDNMYSCERCKK